MRSGGRAESEARARLHSRLLEQQDEIEEAVLTRVYAISDPNDAGPLYRDALRAAVSVAVEYGLEAIECGEERAPPPPPALLAQARLAARAGIALDAVLRRYLAGYALLGDFIVTDIEQRDPEVGAGLVHLFRGQAAVLDRLLAAVSEEYGRELASSASTAARRRAERVQRLLAGEPLDTAELGYDFGYHHTGLIAVGPGAAEVVRALAGRLDRQLLLVQRDDLTVWAWLGSRRSPDPAEAEGGLSGRGDDGIVFTIGEAAAGLAGWRLTHQQAAAALPVARRARLRVARYADVALLAAALRDELLAESLAQLYLTPLEAERDGGKTARQTLRAYFAADRNVSAAAAALRADRRTVANRIRAIEARLGRPLGDCAAELETALRLAQLDEARSRPS